jgi:puromycin-sensitive aminopeptidase
MQQGTSAGARSWDAVALPSSVRPISYDLSLTPHLQEFTFDGEETVTILVKQSTEKIVLHAKELQIKSARFKSSQSGHDWINAHDITLDEKADTATFDFKQQLPVGEAALHIVFTGILNDQMAGFYRTKYSVGNEQRWGACSQFEPTDARRALPCWDEPNVKAIFTVTLIIPKELLGLSNMPVDWEKVEEEKKLKTIKFLPSPIMSTYLLAFVVGEYDFIEGRSEEGIVFRCYTPVGKTHLGRFALDVGVKALSYYTKIFGIGFPLPKIDMIAIQEFAAGAMENWGLITYREAALLIDPAQSSAGRKQAVARTVSHELAHQWFGNLVTMDWWTWLWLNEGFARWVEHLSVNHQFPEWDIWTQFASEVKGSALALDSMKTSHPVEVDVKHPAEINEIFDIISYAKGASVIRMLSYYLGEDTFLKGLHLYLTRHSYANAASDDLWRALEEASGGKPVRDIMLTWTRKIGYPYVTIEPTHAEGDTTTFAVRQSRFLISGEKDEESLWAIPLGVWKEGETGAGHRPEFFLITEKEQRIKVQLPPHHWIKFNAAGTGLYRVNYAASMLPGLGRAVREKSISASDRLGLQDDLYALAKSGIIGSGDYLSFLLNYRDEKEYPVWADISGNLGAFAHILAGDEELEPKFNAFVINLFKPLANSLGWDAKPDEHHLTALLRGLVIERLGNAGDRETVEEARARFKRFLADPTPAVLPPDLRYPVYKIVISEGDEAEWEELSSFYRRTDLSEEQRRCLQALGFTKIPSLIRRLLELSLSDEVRNSDCPFPLAAAGANPKGRNMTWEFMKEKWDVIDKKFGGGLFLISSIIGACTSSFTVEEKADEIEQFFKEHPSPSAERKIQQSLERIRMNAKWLRRERPAIKDFLEKFASSSSSTSSSS